MVAYGKLPPLESTPNPNTVNPKSFIFSPQWIKSLLKAVQNVQAAALCATWLLFHSLQAFGNPVVFEPATNTSHKRIVLVASDHEYRSEETIPALARILAQHHGFHCTVLFGLDKNGEIEAGASNIPGLECLQKADGMVIFTRFLALPPEQMQHIDAYLKRGGPVVGLRTATHAFNYPKTEDPYYKYHYKYSGADYQLGFGHQVLGQTWVGHYGKNHQQSTKIEVVPSQAAHPILRGVRDVHVQAGGYTAEPAEDWNILTMAQPLNGMESNAPADDSKKPMASEWTRTYDADGGVKARVFTSLYGASEDILNPGYRRMLVNAVYWSVGLEDRIKPDSDISFVGPYKPNTFRGGGHAKGIKPSFYADLSSPIPAHNDVVLPKPSEPKAKPAQNASQSNPPSAADSKNALPVHEHGKTTGSAGASHQERSVTAEKFVFHKGDTVAFVGNALADRMHKDGWLETLLQAGLKNQEVRFRNMGVSGDRVDVLPRSKGVPSNSEILSHIKADVIFAFFGYNESYAGVEKADAYRRNLVDFVNALRSQKPNGKSAPRIVLFSPIAHEDLKTANLPSGAENNARLEAYANATAAAAHELGVTYIDLFHPTQDLYRSSKAPLTINGVHLNEAGNKALAELIAKTLLETPIKASSQLASLREAVLDKSFHWHQRFRATDENDVWGGRSTLAFVAEQTNAVVLQHELTMLDVMTANRDQQVWARANGKDLIVSDSNVPDRVSVTSNVGGGSKSSNAMKEGRLHYKSGEEAIADIAAQKGFEIGLFADEKKFPQLINPVQLQVDSRGRLWAAVWPTYPKWEPKKEANDALVLLLDDDSDGKADRLVEFAKVHNPLGFEFWNGGVLVTEGPDLLFLKDTNGDDVADERVVMLQGLGTADTHHAANNLIMGPDGAIYWQSGIFLVNNFESPWGPNLTTGESGMFRFDPRTYAISFHAKNSPNPHGISFDRWGYHYATDGTGGRAYQVRPDAKGFKMQELLKKEVRPVTASEIVSSQHFPESMQGDFLIANVIGYRGIKRYQLLRDAETGNVWGEPAGEDLTVEEVNADGTKTSQTARGFLLSGDKNFRPADVIFGADGALYLADWHNVIIGHMQHNVRDPNRDHERGRVYRITVAGSPLQKPVPIDGEPVAALLENLRHPVDGVRHRTHVELSEHDSNAVEAALRQWIKQFSPQKKEDAHALLEALWVFQQHNIKNVELLGHLLKSPDLHARNAALTVQHLWFNSGGGQQSAPVAEQAAMVQKSGVIADTAEYTEVRISTVVEKMTYDVKEFSVKAGKKVKLTFANPDFMPHNLVIVNPGKADEVGLKAMELGASGFDKGFVPDSVDILANTMLVDHGKEQVLEFSAPSTPGVYIFVCTFPGHHLLMRGTMLVR
jgi:putative membrane-bound dehydrogenase-like protein